MLYYGLYVALWMFFFLCISLSLLLQEQSFLQQLFWFICTFICIVSITLCVFIPVTLSNNTLSLSFFHFSFPLIHQFKKNEHCFSQSYISFHYSRQTCLSPFQSNNPSMPPPPHIHPFIPPSCHTWCLVYPCTQHPSLSASIRVSVPPSPIPSLHSSKY